LTSTSLGWANAIYFYENSFDPENYTGIANFSGTLIDGKSFSMIQPFGFGLDDLVLNPGTDYFLVTTGFRSTDFGAFTNTITGPGNISTVSTAVPETFTIVGTLVGGTAAVRLKKKLKSAHKV
jgi:hypothetical protein